MDIYLTELKNKKSRFTFPSLPEKIGVKYSKKYQSYDIMARGTVKIPMGTEPRTFSWSGTFYGKSKKKEAMIKKGSWKSPASCKKVLNEWLKKGTVLRLLVTGTIINYDVTISSFDYDEVGAYGNAEYSIELVLHKTLNIYTTKELKNAKTSKTNTRSTKVKSKTYKVVSGDNLWKIAKKYYGSGTKWTAIYKENSKVIEAAAKKHGKKNSSNGHWIYPGTVLTIP